jgi:DNA processing protein
MKKLTLNEQFSTKLNRLPLKVEQLFYMGSDLSEFTDSPIVAIVGTRKPTPYGKTVTEELASKLARAGVVIISGNALGIDVIAQKAAIAAGGSVISVVPSDLNHIYPATNRPFVDKIIATGGTLLSEHESNVQPMAHEFLDRNRIIAALSDIVIIPEAAERSGSLNTAKHAKQIGVAIGAVPGQVTSTLSSGTNKLLKDGAHIIRNADDVLELLNIDKSQQQTSLNLTGDNDAQTAVLKAVQSGIVDPQEIQSETNLSPQDYMTAVTMLEVSGRVTTTDLGTLRLL